VGSSAIIIGVAPSEISMAYSALALGVFGAHDPRETEIVLDDIGREARHRRLPGTPEPLRHRPLAPALR
jgi:hypothetical protein